MRLCVYSHFDYTRQRFRIKAARSDGACGPRIVAIRHRFELRSIVRLDAIGEHRFGTAEEFVAVKPGLDKVFEQLVNRGL